jgi:hypothetical protein
VVLHPPGAGALAPKKAVGDVADDGPNALACGGGPNAFACDGAPNALLKVLNPERASGAIGLAAAAGPEPPAFGGCVDAAPLAGSGTDPNPLLNDPAEAAGGVLVVAVAARGGSDAVLGCGAGAVLLPAINVVPNDLITSGSGLDPNALLNPPAA